MSKDFGDGVEEISLEDIILMGFRQFFAVEELIGEICKDNEKVIEFLDYAIEKSKKGE